MASRIFQVAQSLFVTACAGPNRSSRLSILTTKPDGEALSPEQVVELRDAINEWLGSLPVQPSEGG